MKANRNSRFGRGTGSFKCECCGRGTRHTGVQSADSKTCPQCYELAGIENEISDGQVTQEERQPMINELAAEIRAKGGNPDEAFSSILEVGR
jgi:hypothetical protein